MMRRAVLALTVAAGTAVASGAALAQDDPPAIPTAPGSSTPPPAPAPEDATKVNLPPLLVAGRQRGNFPAVAAAIVRPEGTVNHAVLGVRRLESRDVVRLDDGWHLGSCGKAMTATLIGMLVEKGKLRWEMTLAEAFPDLADRMHEGYRAVTLERLLQGRGGVPAEFGAGLWDRVVAFNGSPREARMIIVEDVLSRPPLEGDQYVYSSVAWVIAGAMAEAAAGEGGEAFEDLMQSMLFEPLGMTTAGFGAPGKPVEEGRKPVRMDAPRGHFASGLSQEPGPKADNPPAFAPAGSVHASMEDWGKFIAFQLRALTGKPSPLKPETWAKIMNPPEGQNAAMGWIVHGREWAGGVAMTHDGSNGRWYSVAWMAPRKEFAVLVATNMGGGNVGIACNQLAWDVIQEHLRLTEGREPTPTGR